MKRKEAEEEEEEVKETKKEDEGVCSGLNCNQR